MSTYDEVKGDVENLMRLFWDRLVKPELDEPLRPSSPLFPALSASVDVARLLENGNYPTPTELFEAHSLLYNTFGRALSQSELWQVAKRFYDAISSSIGGDVNKLMNLVLRAVSYIYASYFRHQLRAFIQEDLEKAREDFSHKRAYKYLDALLKLKRSLLDILSSLDRGTSVHVDADTFKSFLINGLNIYPQTADLLAEMFAISTNVLSRDEKDRKHLKKYISEEIADVDLAINELKKVLGVKQGSANVDEEWLRKKQEIERKYMELSNSA